ncbi:TIR domain-containing protein [Prosthecobacter sp.]|uniref:TIR domain-containing protein n=1 Tax=Prosthecobacter sp. TaxID=1965333 RepID=UPI002ABB4C0C|nr:TIR domain-containing protein [Prosthecobacter sp.]MDZ4403288.1 TIR domain-containing protein [Prosthecobacter sp.]
MANNYAFVSCDIVSHSSEPSLQKQTDNVAAINEIVGDIMRVAQPGQVIWASGGDGGHVAFPQEGTTQGALKLILGLRNWSIQAGVRLRITGSCGVAESIKGADERVQLVGLGINLAGRLLPFGDPERVIVTKEFKEWIEAGHGASEQGISFHEEHHIQPASMPGQTVFLLSATGVFQSTWECSLPPSRILLREAVEAGQYFEVVYQSKRLLEIDPQNRLAKNALRELATKGIRHQQEQNLIDDLLRDAQFGFEIVSASALVERRRGETICEHGDHGTTMFLILKGHVGVFFPKKEPSEAIPSKLLFMGPGDLVGDLAFALHRPRTATLICMEDSALLAFNPDELFVRFGQSEVGVPLEANFRRKLLSKIIENMWRTTNYFPGISESEEMSQLPARPWITLLNNAKEEDIPWNRGVIDFKEYEPEFEGICILASGRLRLSDADHMLEGKDYPILTAHFRGEIVKRLGQCQLLEDVKLVRISRRGVMALGSVAYGFIIQRLRENTPAHDRKSGLGTRGRQFDVFLSHHSGDKNFARELKQQLLRKKLTVWYDEHELPPGVPWQASLEMGVKNSKSIIILVGGNGLGDWESEEMQIALGLAVRDKRPVIPVLLPGTGEKPDLPLLLGNRTWVDFRAGFSEDALNKLIWGITEKNPNG